MRARSSSQLQGWLFIGARPAVCRRLRALPARSARRDFADRPVAARRRPVHRLRQLSAHLARRRFLARARIHCQIHDRPHADPDGPRLCAGAADRREHAAQAPDAHHRIPAGGHRPVELEPAVVLAARRTGGPVQQAARRSPCDQRADRLVRLRRSRLLGGGDLDHLEGRRLRHGAVRRRASSRSIPTSSRPRSWTAPAIGAAFAASSCR